MTDAYAQAIRQTAGQIPVIRTGTVVSNYGDPATATYVTLDNDPTATAVRALSAAGVYAKGTRVALLAYPPRGLVIFGRLDGSAEYERLRLTATDDASLSSTLHALQIGPTSGLNLAVDNNEIMARSNGAASTLILNADGGNVTISGNAGSGILQTGANAGTHTFLNNNQLWAMNNAASSTLFLNFTSVAPVQIGTGARSAAGLSSFNNRTFLARDTSTYSGFIGTSFTNLTTISISGIPCPPSGIVTISVGAIVQATATSAANLLVLSAELANITQATTPHGASDNDAAYTAAVLANAPLSLQRTFAVQNCGNAGDSLTVQPMMRVQTGGTWTLTRFWVVVELSP